MNIILTWGSFKWLLWWQHRLLLVRLWRRCKWAEHFCTSRLGRKGRNIACLQDKCNPNTEWKHLNAVQMFQFLNFSHSIALLTQQTVYRGNDGSHQNQATYHDGSWNATVRSLWVGKTFSDEISWPEYASNGSRPPVWSNYSQCYAS